MSIYAIAAFVHNNQVIGARLLNTDTNRIKDCTNSEIIDLINTGNQFSNLSIYRGKLTWNSGVYTRYPQIFADGHIENNNAATILGIFANDKKFKLVNYEGKQIILSETETINYAKKFGISNCKVTHKDNTEFIQQISGNIPELQSKFKFKMTDPTILDVILPEDGSVTELVIPQIVGAFDTKDMEMIRIIPKTEAYRIKKVSFPANYSFIRPHIIRGLFNVEQVIINSTSAYLFERAFEEMPNLKEVHIKGGSFIGTRAFCKCKNLETCRVYSGNCVVKSEAFRFCEKLNLQKFLNSGIETLDGGRIFYKNPAEAVIIPESILRVNYNVFEGMPNLHAIRVDGTSTTLDTEFILDGDLYIKERNQKIMTLIGFGKTEADNYGFKYQNIKVHLIKVEDEDEKTRKTISKAKMAGLSSADTLIYYNRKDVSIILGSKRDNEAREFIIRCVNNSLNSRNYTNYGVEKLGVYSIEYCFRPYDLYKSSIVGEKGDAIFYGTNKVYRIIPTNKKWIIRVNQSDIQINRIPDRNRFTIPYYTIENLGKIDNIEYKDDSITVTFRNKQKKVIDILYCSD